MPSLKELRTAKAAGAPRRVDIRPMRKNPGIRICVIPDTQDEPGAPQENAEWFGRWVKDRNPAVVVHLGDGPDMGSCSSYDAPGSLSAEGRSIQADLDSWRGWLERFRRACGSWRGRKVVTLGNHENRLARYIDAHPEHRDTYGGDPFHYKAFGWEVVPFLEPITIAGVTFIHFAPRSASGKVTQTKNGAPTALAMLKREMRSTVCGHTQGLDVACLTVGGRTLRGVIAGSAYTHECAYLSPQGQGHWAGVLELNEVHDGYFDLCEVSLDYCCRRYGGGRWPK